MKTMRITLIVVSTLLIGFARPSAGVLINLDLNNTEPLLDSDAFTPLAGTTTGGDLVEVILAGADATPNGIDANGNPTGDDTMLFSGDLRLHVGYGVPFDPNAGLLDVFPLQYDSSLVGSNIYVRFFNATSAGGATNYGNSSVFVLPAGTGPNHDQALLDFVPTSSYLHVADIPISLTVIPEPSNLFLFGAVFGGLCWWRKRVKYFTA